MPRIAYVDHSYHRHTRSNDFLVDALEECGCEVIRYWDEAWTGGSAVNLHDLVNFDAIVLFQQTGMFDAPMLRDVHPNITFIPMLDNYGLALGKNRDYSRYWHRFSGIKFINFSQSLHAIIQSNGLVSRHARYYQDPSGQDPAPAAGLHGFFWCRRPDLLSFSILRKLMSGTPFDSFHMHMAVDPNVLQPPLPDPADVARWNMTFSTWFESKADYEAVLARANVFFAPRLEEGIGQAMLEAFARAQCVVAPDFGTMNEYIVHGVNGLLYDPALPTPLDFSRAVSMGRQGRIGALAGYARWCEEKERLVRYILMPLTRREA